MIPYTFEAEEEDVNTLPEAGFYTDRSDTPLGMIYMNSAGADASEISGMYILDTNEYDFTEGMTVYMLKETDAPDHYEDIEEAAKFREKAIWSMEISTIGETKTLNASNSEEIADADFITEISCSSLSVTVQTPKSIDGLDAATIHILKKDGSSVSFSYGGTDSGGTDVNSRTMIFSSPIDLDDIAEVQIKLPKKDLLTISVSQ